MIDQLNIQQMNPPAIAPKCLTNERLPLCPELSDDDAPAIDFSGPGLFDQYVAIYGQTVAPDQTAPTIPSGDDTAGTQTTFTPSPTTLGEALVTAGVNDGTATQAALPASPATLGEALAAAGA